MVQKFCRIVQQIFLVTSSIRNRSTEIHYNALMAAILFQLLKLCSLYQLMFGSRTARSHTKLLFIFAPRSKKHVCFVLSTNTTTYTWTLIKHMLLLCARLRRTVKEGYLCVDMRPRLVTVMYSISVTLGGYTRCYCE